MNFCRVFLVLVLLCASGCALVTRLPPEPGAKTPEGEEIVETVQVMNSSWSLFCLLPLASGNVDSPDCVSCIPFRDSVNLKNQMKMIEAEAKRCGATCARHVVTYEDDEDLFLILLLRRKIHTSAILVR